jgi:hypothetical protein
LEALQPWNTSCRWRSLWEHYNHATASCGGGLFGGTQQPATGGGLFRSTSITQQPATSGVLFGSTTITQQPAMSGSLFGSTSTIQQPAASAGFFGRTTSQQPATTGGHFGNTTTTTQPSGGGLLGTPNIPPRILVGFARQWYDDWTEYKWRGLFGSSQAKPAAGGLFGITATNPTDTNNLFGGGQQQQSNLFGTTTNTDPLPGGKNFFGSTLGISTFGSGEQPQQQQLTAGSLLSSRSAGGLGQQQNDPVSQHVLSLKGYMMRGTLLPLSVGFR